MARWQSRRARSLLLIAACAAVFGGGFFVKDPMPILSARTPFPRAAKLKGAAATAAPASAPAPWPGPRGESAAQAPEGLRDAIGASPTLRLADFDSARGAGSVQRLAAALAASGQDSSRQDPRELARLRPPAPAPETPLSLGGDGRARSARAPAPDYFTSPGWHAWSRRREPQDSGYSLRRLMGQIERACRAQRGAFPESPASARIPVSRPGGAGSPGSLEQTSRAAERKLGRRPWIRKFSPALLSRLVGRKPLRPPAEAIEPPLDNPWNTPMPKTGPDGAPIDPLSPSLLEVEAGSPPARETSSCRKEGGHWHSDGAAAFFHDAPRWGRWAQRRWSWLERGQGGWWVWGGETAPPMLWHEEHWWWKSREVWFLLHEGEPWGYRFFSDLKQDGFIHASGTRMVYSADGSRVGLITPGEGAIVFDAATGRELGRVSEDHIPQSQRPRAPDKLALPD